MFYNGRVYEYVFARFHNQKLIIMEKIIQELGQLGKRLYEKFGTDSYEERCKIHDIKELLKGQKLPIHNVIKPKGTVCEHTDTYYDDRAGIICKECRCVVPE